jgi:hypothetical protein
MVVVGLTRASVGTPPTSTPPIGRPAGGSRRVRLEHHWRLGGTSRRLGSDASDSSTAPIATLTVNEPVAALGQRVATHTPRTRVASNAVGRTDSSLVTVGNSVGARQRSKRPRRRAIPGDYALWT